MKISAHIWFYVELDPLLYFPIPEMFAGKQLTAVVFPEVGGGVV